MRLSFASAIVLSLHLSGFELRGLGGIEDLLHDFTGRDRKTVVNQHTGYFCPQFRVLVFDNGRHLRVAVLLYQIDGVVLGEKISDLAAQWQGSDQQVVGFQASGAQPVSRLPDRLKARSVADDTRLYALGDLNDRFRDLFAGSIELFSQPVETVLVIMLIFRIFGVGIMAGTAGEIRSHPVRITRHGSVRDAIAVLIEIAAEFLSGFGPLFELFRI